ncbi:hypothetical protein NDU88_004866 [Pleurodeles waltl]|uniref:Uncharacterized protein n=1 Tax=Pleurodeles waltl TaxID=8319 RepID=A0AAV7KZL0_PLEWA|nr:hypothetical protein NDU88_004866 [Pleurodeles waltl]
MDPAPDQATSPRAGSQSPTTPPACHSFMAYAASPPLPQQAACPTSASAVQALVAIHHLLSLTRPSAATSRPHNGPHYARSPVAATAGGRRTSSGAKPPGPGVPRGLAPPICSPSPFTASGTPCHRPTARQPPGRPAREAGGCGTTRPPIAPQARLTGVHNSRDRRHSQPPASKRPTGQRHTGRPTRPLLQPGRAAPSPHREPRRRPRE